MNVKVDLRPIASRLNLPTVLKTAILPGDSVERLFIATQVGEIFFVGNDRRLQTFLDIRSRVIQLDGYDERGFLGFAFHPGFYYNGLFYIHYSVAGSQGPGAPHESFQPDPCSPETLKHKWTNRDTDYDHIDTVEEWVLHTNGQTQKRRTLLNLRRPFSNHNGVNSLNFSPETRRLVITTGDGGSGFDPYHLSQDPMEIAGKIFEMDVDHSPFIQNPPAATRFDELPVSIQKTMTVIVMGVRNIPGITYQRYNQHYIKYIGQVGQELVETIYSFIHYRPLLVPELIRAAQRNSPHPSGLINLGWRGWEGDFPTMITRDCQTSQASDEKTVAYFQDAVNMSAKRLRPLTSYFHQDERSDKFAGSALTGVQVYMGNELPALTGSIVFTDFARREASEGPTRGVLAYTRERLNGKPSDFYVIDTNDPFGSQSAYFTSLGANLNQSKLYLGVHGSMRVTDYHQGAVFEITSPNN